MVDDYSRAISVYLLVDNIEMASVLEHFFSMVERQFERRIKIVRSDNGTDFTCLKSYYLEHGIIFQTTCVGTPQQNGRVGCKYQHILNVARALQLQSSLPIWFRENVR